MPPTQDWISSKARIQETQKYGKGLFALKDIRKGEEVLIWGGIYVNTQEAQKARDEGKLVMQFDEDLFSIEDRGEYESYFLNHSCDPNLWMKDAFTFEAIRNIEKGEELTADYAMFMADENYISSWQCGCNSPNCRGHVTGKDWKNVDLQRKYKSHFIPLINKKIA